jgi:hypothetical protein
MKLYVDSNKPKVSVWRTGCIIKVKVGWYPIGIVAQLVVFACVSLMFMVVFLLLALKLFLGYESGVAYESGWVLYLLLELFFISGAVLASWCFNTLMMSILPFSAEIDIDSKTMCYGNILWRRKCQLGDEVLLLVEPSYSRGDWGFSMKIISKGRKCLFLPGVFVGAYGKAISRARDLAKMIQKCAPFVRIEESKYWKILA